MSFTSASLARIARARSPILPARCRLGGRAPLVTLSLAMAVTATPILAADPDPTGTSGLGPVTVWGSRIQEYAPASGQTATKIDAPIVATPLTINTVGRQVIEDQLDLRLEDVLRNVPGVQSVDSSGWGAKAFYLRGFEVNALYVDGVRLADYSEVDPSMIERVEVLKGAAGGLYGRIDPGGVINIVTRSPQMQAGVAIAATTGSFSTQRIELDATGPIAGNDTVLYRGIATYQFNRSFRDQVLNNHVLLAPSLMVLPSDHDRIDLKVVYQDFTDTTDYGVPVVPYQVDPDGTAHNRLGNYSDHLYIGPADNFVRAKTYRVTASWTHEMGAWSIRPIVGWTQVDQPGNEGGFTNWLNQPDAGWGSVDPILAALYVGVPSNFKQRSSFAEIDVTGHFEWPQARHDVLISGESYHHDYRYEFWSPASATPNPIDVTAPAYQSTRLFYTPPTVDPTVSNIAGDRWSSFTAQDLLTIADRVRVLAGYRYDRSSTTSTGSYMGYAYGIADAHDSRWLPRLGVSVDATPWLALYGSYSESYGLNDYQVLYDGSTSKSQTARQTELGLKGHWFQDRLRATATYFDLLKHGIVVDVPAAELGESCVVPDPFMPLDCLAQLGSEGSRGVELEITGRVNSTLELTAAYAHINATVRDAGDQTAGATSLPAGNSLKGVPVDSGSLWLQYRGASGFGAGLGLEAASRRPFDLAHTMDLPGYIQADAAMSYGFRLRGVSYIVELKVNDLSDARAYGQASQFGSGTLPGGPRSAYATIRASLQ